MQAKGFKIHKIVQSNIIDHNVSVFFFHIYSSIINTVFGKEIAKEGAGRPVTQHFQRFEPEDKAIILYDSKGMEVGMKLEEFIESTLEYFTSCNNGKRENCMKDQIDIVWYIVNSAAARFQQFEEEICKQLFNDIPIIFILNKTDISTKEQQIALREVIKEMNLSNCLGIFNSITAKYCGTPKTCERCGSPDLIVYKRQKKCVCEECEHTFSSEISNGLNKIIEYVIVNS